MSMPGACPRCQAPLPVVPAGGVLICPGCGSRISGETPPGVDTWGTVVEPRLPTVVPETVTADAAELAPTATADRNGRFSLAPDAPGPALAGFEGIAYLGSGGMGVVYRAVQTGTQRTVALKFLQIGGSLIPGVRSRFVGEAHALARIDHPHIVRIHDAGEDETGRPYIAMEYVSGGSLGRLVRAGPVDPREAARIMAGVAAAVEAAHRVNVLHRDIKPGNVLLTADGTPKVTDFGLAKLGDRDEGLTVSGAVMGTPSYMAPEQAGGHRTAFDPRIDVYGLGATLYELLTGHPPYRGPTSAATLRLVEQAALVPPSRHRAGLPAELEAICVKCLSKDPLDRYPTAGAVAEDLDRFLTGEPTVARPLTRWGKVRRWTKRYRLPLAAAVLLTLIAATAAVARRESDPRRRMERSLRRADPVTIIGETGPPTVPGRWVVGEVKTTTSLSGDGTFAFQTHDESVLELCPDPQVNHYILTAEVRHVRTASDMSAAGVYVGCPGSTNAENVRFNRYLRVVFNDFRRKADQLPAIQAAHGVEARDQVYAIAPGTIQAEQFWAANFPYPPANQQPNPWRKLELDVSPDGIVVHWWPDEKTRLKSHELPAKGFDDRAVTLRTRFPNLLQPAPTPLPSWGPRGPVGLWLVEAAADFRNVTITPVRSTTP
jgi:serine/threonine-protein kinase